ncbi:MAG: molybdopterin binding aldehyde oxidase and xanthine dehydrogenase [Planctomycetota bacterium]|nr:MAG: molybdopterin binding aldehyde oxidase and xanthine dehydrogenase [Planctomycetota bacterium]
MRVVGRKVERKEGRAKVTGAARYVDDLRMPGMLIGRTVRAPIACGELVGIKTELGGPGFTTVDFCDIPGKNVVSLIAEDQPCLVEREIRHAEEPVFLIAHESREALLEARVSLECRPGVPVFDPLASPRSFKDILIEKGDVAKGFAEAALIVEGEYRAGLQEHVSIEPNGVIAWPENGGIAVLGSLQCPYYVHRALMTLLALPPEKVRVCQAETGGGFGGKEEYPSMLAGHAALLALKSKRPVKIVYDREEEMAATTKRHPAIVRHRTGVAKDGRLVAQDIEVILDGGAYVTLSPVVLSRACIHAAGPYRCANVRIRGRAMFTNTVPNGAFRGFGAPQTQFAGEAHMDRIAEALGEDPVKLRETNALRPGDTTATGQRMHDDCSALEVLREAVKRTRFPEKRWKWKGTGRGIGLALFYHGAGFTGSGEVKLASKAALELTERGARILTGTTEMGQGQRTTHAQIVAEELGWPYEAIEVAEVDTARVPDSGPTVASRTCMIVGGILQACAKELKAKLGRLTPRAYLKRNGPLVVTKSYEHPGDVAWNDETYRGDAYGTFAWGCEVAELNVDPDTYEARLTKFTAVVEIGKAIHPVLAAGQVEGGAAQGIGYALLEEAILRDGRMANASMTNYIIPTTVDTPTIETVILERPYRHGPFGAKGVGELPVDGAAPAIVNALRHAGADIRRIPATPERIMEALCASR